MRALITMIYLVGLTGCAEVGTREAEPQRLLPATFNDVMVALVNDAADPIWMAAWKNPESDADWRALERHAYQLKLAGSLLQTPGTGPLDRQWASFDRWRQWSSELAESGSMAIEAVQTRNVVALGEAGDRIVEVCEGCHMDFKLPIPTGGRFGERSPTPSDFQQP